MLLERKDDPRVRCPFCHDGLAASRLVECGSCRAVYHAECVERCVVLGCQGALTDSGASPDPAPTVPRAVLRLALPARAAERPPPRSPRFVALCRLASVVALVGFVAFLAVGTLTETWALLAPSLACFVACVAFAQGETDPVGPRREREAQARRGRAQAYRTPTTRGLPAVEPVAPTSESPLAAPPPATFPAMFGAPPTPAAGAAVDDEALRRISARREARRPGGLGKTL